MQREWYAAELRRKQVIGYFYVDGKRLRRKLCSFDDIGFDDNGNPKDSSKRNAKKIKAVLDKIHREIEIQLLADSDLRRTNHQTVKTLFQEWINWGKINRSPKTVEIYLSAANKYMKGVGDHLIGKTTLRQIDKVTAHLIESGNAPASVNMTLRTLKSFFRWCAAREELGKVPEIKMVSEPQSFPKALSDENLLRLFRRIEQLKFRETNPAKIRALHHHFRFLMVASHTGMRRSEVVFLPWSGIDLEKGEIHIRNHSRFTVKEGREKSVPMHNDLEVYLKQERVAHPGENWLLDDGEGNLGYLRAESMTKAFNRHFRALGLNGLGIKATHFNRALMAGRMREAGADLALIQSTLGHSSIEVTQLYFPDDDNLKKIAIRNLPSFGAKLAQIKT